MTRLTIQKQDEIPQEYLLLLELIPENEIVSFKHSYSTLSATLNPYIKLLNAIKDTIRLFTKPSPYWYFMLGRISVNSCFYDEILEEYEEKHELLPFIGRILMFQGQYETALNYCNKTLEKLDIERSPGPIETLLYYEAMFTKGLTLTYLRKFEEVTQVAQTLETYLSKYFIQKQLPKPLLTILHSYSYLISALKNLYEGKIPDLIELIDSFANWVEAVEDPWIRGYYYNLAGISYFIRQKMITGEEKLRQALDDFNKVRDLRGYSITGANLGNALILQGRRTEGSKVLENVVRALTELQNYPMALGNILSLSKVYVDEKNTEKALEYVKMAENIAEKTNIGDSAILSLFVYLYSKLDQPDKATFYLEKLREAAGISQDKSLDQAFKENSYNALWYLTAEATMAMSEGDLKRSMSILLKGLSQADQSGHYDSSLELTNLLLEVLIKRYLLDQNPNVLHQTIEILLDLKPLVATIDNPYYQALFNLMIGYLYLGIDNYSEAMMQYELAKRYDIEHEESIHHSEIERFEQRMNFFSPENKNSEEYQMEKSILKVWITDEYLSIFFAMEALRLLHSLQFQQTSLGEKIAESDVLPTMLLLLNTEGYILYSYHFNEKNTVDEVLIGGFLAAVSGFSKELFGEGSIKRIEQENQVLLLERLGPRAIMVLIADKETYAIRKKFRKISQEFFEMGVVEYFNADVFLSNDDIAWQELDILISQVFGTPPEQ